MFPVFLDTCVLLRPYLCDTLLSIAEAGVYRPLWSPTVMIEELGLDQPLGRILALDWVPSRPERPECVIVIYDGGVLSGDEIEAIIVPGGELAGYEFVHPDQVARRVAPLVARRVAASLEALAAATIASLEGGSPTG
jgi:hypothetical protein